VSVPGPAQGANARPILDWTLSTNKKAGFYSGLFDTLYKENLNSFQQPRQGPPSTRDHITRSPGWCQSPVLGTRGHGIISLTTPFSYRRLAVKYLQNLGVPWSPPRRKVTIGIGLICDSGMILASDSQTTRGAAKIQTQKINVVDFADSQVLIAQAGLADLSEGTIDKMRQKAKAERIESPETVMQIAQEAVRGTYKHFWDLDHLDRLSHDDVWDYFQQREFTLLIGFYHNRKPHLFTISLGSCYPRPVKNHFEVIGIGSPLAGYLLSEYAQEGIAFEDGYPLSVYVVEKVIDSVEGCGRPTWAGITFPTDEHELKMLKVAASQSRLRKDRPIYESQAIILRKDDVALVASELRDGESKAKEPHRNYIREVMRSVTKKRLDKIASEYQGSAGSMPLED
jgi:20S proteasome alpha/beta subunit